jgi:drug/metabolite transporter (DMT)-like permease
MELSLTGTLFSMLTGLVLACFYMLNKKMAFAGKPLLVIFWVFACHLPIFIVWVVLQPPQHVSVSYFLPGLAVLALTITGNLLTIRALSLSPFSLMVPVLGLSPVFASFISIPLLEEWPSSLQWCGIVLAVIGVFWLYAPVERPWDIFSFWPRFVQERGAMSMTLAAMMWAVSSPMDKLALRQADPQFHALFVFTGFVIALFIWLALHGEMPDRPIAREHWPLLIFTGAVGGFAYIMQLLALQHTPAGPFEAIKRVISQIAALALGYFLFREKITKPKLIGIVILSVGVPLIVL